MIPENMNVGTAIVEKKYTVNNIEKTASIIEFYLFSINGKETVLGMQPDEGLDFTGMKTIKEKKIIINDLEGKYKEERSATGLYIKEILLSIPRDENEKILPAEIKILYWKVSLEEKEILDKIISTIKKNDLSYDEIIKRNEKNE